MTHLPNLFTIEEAASILRIGRTKAYSMSKQYRLTGIGLPVVDISGQFRVPRVELEEMIGCAIDSLPSEPNPAIKVSRKINGDNHSPRNEMISDDETELADGVSPVAELRSDHGPELETSKPASASARRKRTRRTKAIGTSQMSLDLTA